MNNDTTCSAPDCARGIAVRRLLLCGAHYQQHAAGKPFAPIRRRAGAPEPGIVCSFAGCTNIRTVRELCARHHYQRARGGDLKPLRTPFVPVATRNEDGNKWCSTCEGWRPESSFARSKGKADGLQTRCRDCNADIYRANAEQVRDKMRQQRFGITRAEFDAWFDSQGNVCATCGTDDPGKNYWCVDHDHACCPGSDRTCGKCIRGILCGQCNHALGNVKDNIETLNSMIDYLNERSVLKNPTRTRAAR